MTSSFVLPSLSNPGKKQNFANLNHDLAKLGKLLDKYPNLYADISARYAESATIPLFMETFYEKYQDRLMYGTDMGYDAPMYRLTFRILESKDEHFYESGYGYHWALNGIGLSKDVLKKLYHENAAKILSLKPWDFQILFKWDGHIAFNISPMV